MPRPVIHNPFATRFTQPGALPFLLRPGETLDAIAEQFRSSRYLGQIVGNHGSGKTTLTHSLESVLRIDFPTIRRVTIRDRKTVLAQPSQGPVKSTSNGCLIVVDGIQRLPWLHRKMLLQQIRYPKTGLLITTHRALFGIPVLYNAFPTMETLKELTKQLAPRLAIDDQVLGSVFRQNPENIRESFMSLYDWFERLDSMDDQWN